MRFIPGRVGVRLSAILTLVCGISIVPMRDQWLGVWAVTDTFVGSALVLALPAAAGCGALCGSMVRRSGLPELADFGPLDRLRVETRLAAELTLWLGLGVVLCTALAWVDTARFATVMSPEATLLIPRLAIVGFAGSFGVLVGRRLPAIVAVPLAAITPYAVIGVLTYVADPLLESVTPIDERFMWFSTVRAMPSVLRAGVWLLGTAGLVLLLSRRHREAIAVAWLAGLVAAPLILIGNADRQHVPSAAAPLCHESERILVCLPRAVAYLDAGLAQDILLVSDLMDGLAPRRAAWIEENAEWQGRSEARWEALRKKAASEGYDQYWIEHAGWLNTYTQLHDDRIRAQLIAVFLPQPGIYDDQGDPLPVGPNEALLYWAFERAHAEFGDPTPYQMPRHVERAHSAQMRWFDGLSHDARARFLSDHADEIEQIRLGWSAFGRA